ncbi:MAG TPA: hypothetical protein QF730_10930 [Planctomycetota bacterium]|nr:hypothetical protein [Planctomycetota bacterium]
MSAINGGQASECGATPEPGGMNRRSLLRNGATAVGAMSAEEAAQRAKAAEEFKARYK